MLGRVEMCMLLIEKYVTPGCSQENTIASEKDTVEMLECHCRNEQWCHIHSQSGIKFSLKVYSLISYRGCSQKISNFNFWHLFAAYIPEIHFLKGMWQKSFLHEIRAILGKILVSENLFNIVVHGAGQMHLIMHNLWTKN